VGNEDPAWDQADEHWEEIIKIHKELSIPYLMWLLKRTIYSRDEIRQQDLVTALRAWANEQNTPMSVAEQVDLELAYGDIAIQRGMLKQAHEIFSRAAVKPAFQSSSKHFDASLRKAMVERLAKNFDAALETLEELSLERVPELWAPVRYAKAEVLFDMEEYEDASEVIDSVLANDPNHADALILQGKLNLGMQKLMEATNLDLGAASAQKQLVPGEQLKVTLVDPTLAVSGAGTEIEVVVWATSGDKEQFFLRRFGDEKTKFRGEVDTELGPPSPGDRILQVVGDDEIYYAYSDRFVSKIPGMEARRGGPITVASDGLLIASARRLMTAEEQRLKDMEKEMASLRIREEERNSSKAQLLYKMQLAQESSKLPGNKSKGEARIIKRNEGETDVETLVKPGQKIHIRVVDPDRSRTAGIDELPVSVKTSSGDSVSRIVLKETGTHTGWFEGSVETTGAQATATGSAAEPGRNPNMVISPRTDYPAWRPLEQKNKDPYFTIDLNDNVEIGEMIITASEAGAKIKRFLLETGLNHGELNTVGAFPNNYVSLEKPWSPSVTVITDQHPYHGGNQRKGLIGSFFSDIRQHLNYDWIKQDHMQGLSRNVAGPSDALPGDIPGLLKWRRHTGHEGSVVVSRFRAYFYEDEDVVRQFKMELGKFSIPPKTHPSLTQPKGQYMLVVDGRPLGDEKNNWLEGSIALRKGIHTIELWANGWAQTTLGFGRTTQLLSNYENPEVLSPCPDSMFDPANFPQGTLPFANAKADIEALDDGKHSKSRLPLVHVPVLSRSC
jgi:tetratricopeptide (TPR) repeat protein